MVYIYEPEGVCAKEMTVELDGSVVGEVTITGGCPGNILGIAKLLEGMDVDTAVLKMAGIPCKRGKDGTSCPDQLSKAILKARAKLAAV